MGKYLPQVIDGIGGEIDFVILDTVHAMPGEGLDFLAVFPYLKIGAVIVMHDVSYNQLRPENFHGNATTVLLSAVTSDKFLNFIPNGFTLEGGNYKFFYPNIAAIQISEQTVMNIENVFLTMIIRWTYFPSEGEINLYLAHFQRYYTEELCDIFHEAVKMNHYNISKILSARIQSSK